MFEIRADDLGKAAAGSDAELQDAILRAVEPISGEVSLEQYKPVKDARGKIVAYDAWVVR
jgi:hypothetical protein